MYVYALTGRSKLIKIGFTRNIGSRMDALKRELLDFRFLGAEWFSTGEEAKLREAELHRIFRSKRAIGEWFSITEQELLHEFTPNPAIKLLSGREARSITFLCSVPMEPF